MTIKSKSNGNWIPAFAGMTSKNAIGQTLKRSGGRRSGGQAIVDRGVVGSSSRGLASGAHAISKEKTGQQQPHKRLTRNFLPLIFPSRKRASACAA